MLSFQFHSVGSVELTVNSWIWPMAGHIMYTRIDCVNATLENPASSSPSGASRSVGTATFHSLPCQLTAVTLPFHGSMYASKLFVQPVASAP